MPSGRGIGVAPCSTRPARRPSTSAVEADATTRDTRSQDWKSGSRSTSTKLLHCHASGIRRGGLFRSSLAGFSRGEQHHEVGRQHHGREQKPRAGQPSPPDAPRGSAERQAQASCSRQRTVRR